MRRHRIVLRATLFTLFCMLACGRKTGSPAAPDSSPASLAPAPPPTAEEPPSSQASAAGSNEPVPHVVFCHMGLGLCAEWTGLTGPELAKARAACTDDATLDTTPCPQKDQLGTCEHWNYQGMIMATEKLKMHLYRSDVLTSVEGAKAFCDTGTFVEAKAR